MAPNVHFLSVTYEWKEQPGDGQTTLGVTLPFAEILWIRKVSMCPFGQTMVALNFLTVEG